MDYLSAILNRKQKEIERRLKHRKIIDEWSELNAIDKDRGQLALQKLRRRTSERIHVIGEVKFASPSAGVIRSPKPHLGIDLAQSYEQGGASAVSVLADRIGFHGSALEVRRVVRNINLPVLFKEFVLNEIQISLARAMGASMVLLLVRALSFEQLCLLIALTKKMGLEPVVEAADLNELNIALKTDATIIGLNARDLKTFHVDMKATFQGIEQIPLDRIAVWMSGIQSFEVFSQVSNTRADAVLIGEGLAREKDPAQCLAQWLGGV